MTEPLVIAMSQGKEITLLPQMANRHGLITGATGTGKTVTLQKMAESFADIGVPVFMADVKGDLSGICAAGTASEKLLKRLESIGIKHFTPRANTTVFWDVLVQPVIRCAPRYPTWGRCCWRVCSTLTKPSPVCCNWYSRLPTTMLCF